MIKITNRGEKPIEVRTYVQGTIEHLASTVTLEVGLSEEFAVPGQVGRLEIVEVDPK